MGRDAIQDHKIMENFMMRKNNCLSEEDCECLIDFFNKNEKIAKQGDIGNIMKLDDLEIPISVFSSPFLKKNILKAFNTYENKFPLLKTNHNQWQVDDIAYLMRYEPKDHYSYIHCETDGSPNRVLAWMIYLNTIKIGGGTEFIHQKTTLFPIAGDLYIWPANWTYMHRGVPAPNERKYIITGWASNIYH